jgi:hypothetical protein
MWIRGMHIEIWWENQTKRDPLGRPRSRWEDNIKMDFRETGWGGMDLINVARDRNQRWDLVNTVISLQVP